MKKQRKVGKSISAINIKHNTPNYETYDFMLAQDPEDLKIN
jgi:hypothetical protein